MGTRIPDQNPYAKAMTAMKTYIADRFAHPEQLTPSQSAEEIAQFIHQVIEEKTPKLRYQTSEDAKKTVMQWIHDTSGENFMTSMKDYRLE